MRTRGWHTFLQPKEEPGSRDDESEMRFEDESQGAGEKGLSKMPIDTSPLKSSKCNPWSRSVYFPPPRQRKWKRHGSEKDGPWQQKFNLKMPWKICPRFQVEEVSNQLCHMMPEGSGSNVARSPIAIDGQIATRWSDGPETNQTAQFSLDDPLAG